MKLTDEGKETLPAFKRFGAALVASEDIDPLYPVLRWLQHDMDEEQALWHSFLYVAWYNLPSATAAFTRVPQRHHNAVKLALEGWPTGVERRNHRGVSAALSDHIESYLIATKRGQARWYHDNLYSEDLNAGLSDWRQINWQIVNQRLQTIFGNGRWAAYKHLEVLRRVNGLPVEAPDMGHQFSSGPRQGLAMLYGPLEGQDAATIQQLDARGVDLQRRLERRGLSVDIEQLETILCNWKSLVKGKYYVGHDIDELLEQIIHARDQRCIIGGVEYHQLMDARLATLPHAYLAEVNQWRWEGVDKARMAAYRDSGRILVRKER